MMGHEMGHYVLNHIWMLILSVTLVFLAMFFVVSRLAPALIARNRAGSYATSPIQPRHPCCCCLPVCAGWC